MLEGRILALQERATQGRLVDRFRVGFERLPRSRACSKQARENEHTTGAQQMILHEIPQRFTRLQRSMAAIKSRCALGSTDGPFLG